jgi:hypothetical protein
MTQFLKRAKKVMTVSYANGKIYKVVNDVNDCVYFGSTTQPLSKRFSAHKATVGSTKFYNAMKTIGPDHFKIVLVELFACNTKAELEAREYAVTAQHPKDQLYNSIMHGKHSESTKKRMTAPRVSYPRGRIVMRPVAKMVIFEWKENGEKKSKSFSYGDRRTKADATMLCLTMREKMFPLTNKEIFDELPFACD